MDWGLINAAAGKNKSAGKLLVKVEKKDNRKHTSDTTDEKSRDERDRYFVSSSCKLFSLLFVIVS